MPRLCVFWCVSQLPALECPGATEGFLAIFGLGLIIGVCIVLGGQKLIRISNPTSLYTSPVALPLSAAKVALLKKP